MERYEEYKDSGVEWIGEIPQGWGTSRLKELLSDVPHALADGPFGSDMKSDEYQECGVPITQLNNIKEGVHKDDAFNYVSEEKAETLSSHYVFPGDLIMAKMMPAGRTCIASSAYPKYLLSSDSIRIVPADSIDRRYLCYAANAYACIEAELMSAGTTRVRINLGIVRNMRFAIPSFATQSRVADYLDAKTAEIDSLVADCEREVELLQEYRKSIISEAVTKGLDPNVPMKDSGVEWIGEIPESWNVKPLKEYCSIAGGATPSKAVVDYWDGDIPWVSSQEVKEAHLYDTALHITKEAVDSCSTNIYPSGSIVVVVRSGILKHTLPVAMLEVPMSINQDVKALSFRSSATAGYFLYYVAGLNDSLLTYLSKDGSTVDNLDVYLLSHCPLIEPSTAEQQAIVAYLDAKTTEIDALIELKQSMADKLHEYRKSLIFEAVTGKFKVPGV